MFTLIELTLLLNNEFGNVESMIDDLEGSESVQILLI